MYVTSKVRCTTGPRLVARVKVWVECENKYAFGHGLCEILKAIDQSDSIKQAARDVGKSYRHVWSRIKEAEEAGGRPLVETRVGGTGTRRSCLTEDARHLVAGFLAFRGRMAHLVEREFARHFPSAGGSAPDTR